MPLETVPAFESRKQTFLILGALVVLVGLAAITIWLFFFNKGTLMILSDPPYRIQVPDVADIDCGAAECKVELVSGVYRIQLSRPAHESQLLEVEIERGKETRKEVTFVYVPQVSLVGKAGEAKLITDFPLQFQSISLFDSAPEYKDVSAFLDAKKSDLFTWDPKSKSFFFLDEDSENHSQALYLTSSPFEEIRRILFFPRDIENALLAINDDSNYLALVDMGQEEYQIYVIDLQKKGKENVARWENITRIKWIGSDYLLFESLGKEGVVDLHFLDIRKKEVKEFPFPADFMNVTTGKNGRMIFVSEGVKTMDTQSDGLAGNTLFPKEVTGGFFGSELDPESGENVSVFQLPEQFSSLPDRIELSEDGLRLRVLAGGEIYDIRMFGS